MTRALELRDIRVAYEAAVVLDGVEVGVEPGEFLVIIGPNGAGKTTLLKVMAGLLRPATGRIEVLGLPLGNYAGTELARKVAVVSQQTRFDFPFTVAETVLMGRSPYLGLLGLEGPEDHAIARQAMTFTSVSHLAGRRLDRLSGGELQRTFIARALCQQPDILLLDEPTASLDPAHQLRVMDLLERLRQEHGTTVIMVSHDLNLAAMYGDRVLLMKGGRVLAAGRPDEVLTETRLQECYGCTLQVDAGLGGAPRISLVPEKFKTGAG